MNDSDFILWFKKINSLPLSLLLSSWKKRSLPKKASKSAKYYLTKSELNNLQDSKSLHYQR